MSKTLVDINDKLMEEAKELTGLKKKEILNKALEAFVRQKKIQSIKELKGKIDWEGDLDEMRRDRSETCFNQSE